MGNTLIIGINLGDRGSTGSIMRSSLEYAAENGNFDYLVIVPKEEGKPNSFGYLKCKNSIVDKLDRHFFHRSINNPDGFYERTNLLLTLKFLFTSITSTWHALIYAIYLISLLKKRKFIEFFTLCMTVGLLLAVVIFLKDKNVKNG